MQVEYCGVVLKKPQDTQGCLSKIFSEVLRIPITYLVLSTLFLSDVRHLTYNLDHLLWMKSGVGEIEAFSNFDHVWPNFSELLLG